LVQLIRDVVYKIFEQTRIGSIKNQRTLAILGVKDLDQMKTHLKESGGIKKGLEELKKVWNGPHPTIRSWWKIKSWTIKNQW